MDKLDAEKIHATLASWTEILLPYITNALTAVMLLIAGFYISGIVSRLIKTRLKKIDTVDRTIIPILSQLAHYIIIIFTIILVLAEFGVQTTSIIAVLGAAGLAIGLALQGTLQNVAAGIMLLILRPFQIGDFIEASGNAGTVDRIGLFMTYIHTSQGIFIAMPNSKIWADTIINYTKGNERRLDLTIGISYDDDIDKAIDVINSVIKEEDRILETPSKPTVFVYDLGDSSVNLQIRAWIGTSNFWNTRFDLTRAVKYALDKEGISIPYPHMQVIMEKQEAPAPIKPEPIKPEPRKPATKKTPAKRQSTTTRKRTNPK